MNEHEAARIAAAMHHLRPDWPVKSLMTLLMTKLADRPRRDVAVALAWVACESNSATPARVLEPGPWWRAALIEAPNSMTRQPPKRDEQCPRHAGEWHDACRLCAAERIAKAEEEPSEPVEPQSTASGYAAAIRGQLASFRASTCLHGTPIKRCAECTKANAAPAQVRANTPADGGEA